MSTLSGPSPHAQDDRGAEPAASAVYLASGVLAAFQAVLLSAVVVTTVVLAAWLTAGDAAGRWGQVLRLGLLVWLVAHGTSLEVHGERLDVLPLGLALLPVAACWFAARRLGRAMDLEAVPDRRGALPALLSFTATYALVAALVCLVAGSGQVRPSVPRALLGALAVALLSGAAGLAAQRHGGLPRGLRAGVRAVRLPHAVRCWIAPATVALCVHLAGSAAVLAVALGTTHHRVSGVYTRLDPGVVGGTVLGLLQVAVLPNLVVWVAAVAAGPGFAVGDGTALTLSTSRVDGVPALPVLGALPEAGELPGWARLLLLLPVVAGAVAGALVVVRRGRLLTRLRDVVGAAVLGGLGLLVLAALSGGVLRSGGLGRIGPSPLPVGLAFCGEVALGAVVVVLAAHLRRPLEISPEDPRPRGRHPRAGIPRWVLPSPAHIGTPRRPHRPRWSHRR